MTYKYALTRQKEDGTFDLSSPEDNTVVEGLSTYQRTYVYRIRPFGKGRIVQVSVYWEKDGHTNLIETFTVSTSDVGSV